jgi:putative nucleotidyltransferase with HDIG domain
MLTEPPPVLRPGPGSRGTAPAAPAAAGPVAGTAASTTTTSSAAAGDLTAEVLDAVAARLRPAGLLLAVFGPDGSLGYADARAAGFFNQYVIPALRSQTNPAARLPGRPVSVVRAADGAPAAPAAAGWRHVPGVLMAGFAHAARRQQPAGLVVLAARDESFALTEDVLRACGRLGVDGPAVRAMATELPGYGVPALERQARLLPDTLADQVRLAALGREVGSLSQQLADTYEELTLIYQLSSGMKVNRRAGDFFKQACLDVMQVMDVRGMGVAVDVAVQGQPEPAVYGRVALAPADVRRLTGDVLAALRAAKAPIRVADVAADPAYVWLAAHARQMLAVPLMRQDQVLGCLFALDREDGQDFDSVDAKLLTSIANESGVYLENATLFDDVHGLMMGLLHSLTSAVDAKDTYTCGHSERVALLSRHLAQEAGLPDAEVERVYMAGLLHDVGKIGVPESVLQKAGRLTPDEFEQMKKHPEVGARILADVKQLQSVLPGVLHHHERYDGKGYPHGLSGDKIPLMGRIICLADCFDAMTSNRTYRRALPVEVAMSEIRRCSGTQFDPALAEAFLRTPPDALRELLRDHKERSKRLIEMQENVRGK